MGDHVSHRPGPLKQTNKAHKTTHRSKRSIDNAAKGRVSINVLTRKHKEIQRRDQRRNQINQLRKKKREEALNIKRQLGGEYTAPFLVCILPMHSQIDANSALAILAGCDSEAIVDRSNSGVTYINMPCFKQRFAFIIPPTGHGSELTVLEYLKVADTTLLLTSAAMGENEVFDKWGHRVFNMISAQGIPAPIVGLMDLQSINPKCRSSAKSAAQKFISKVLPDQKLIQLDTNAEGLNMLRRIGGLKRNILHNKSNRPHMFGDVVQFVPSNNPEEEFGSLRVTGFLRGTPLDVNGLVHIAGLGDFQMSHIDALPDPYQFKTTKEISAIPIVLITADPLKQQTLQSENIPDSMDAEQTWPTDQEIELSRQANKEIKHIKRIPKDWNSYQAAWIPDVEEKIVLDKNFNVDKHIDYDEEDNDDEDEDNDDEYAADDAVMCCDNRSSVEMNEECEDGGTEEDVETVSISDATALNAEKYDLEMDLQEERETMRKIKESRIDEMWPDEIDTPLNVAACDRFQKYRGLESFRSSPWDTKENLPKDFARIYQFQNFDRTKRRIIKESKNVAGPKSGVYLTLNIINVPQSEWRAFRSGRMSDSLIVYGMLPHEQRMSVMNVVLKRLPNSEVPIKSKERLIIQCGYRRFVVNPIFSQHTNGDKHKFERYFRPYTTLCASFYAPIQFPPAPVLAFKENPDSSLNLIARGCVLSCNPDRIVLKRVCLTGHPMRINRKSATVRYMFFNKEDVDYFKPVKLRTKFGRMGHIKESLGTHGHMKCMFDGQLRSYDTVFMYLYKRMYPKWTYEQCLVRCPDIEQMQH